MKELFNKPILDQMYEFRKDYFEQYVYENNKKIRDIESKVCGISENLIMFLKQNIQNKKDCEKAIKMLDNYALELSSEMEFWSCTYFKLGMIEREKIRNELFANNMEVKENDTFINYELNGFSDWVEEQKRKYTFETKEYKELQKRYNEISEKYPNAIEVFEDLNNYMKDGVLIRQVVNVLNEIDLTDFQTRHAFNEIYETILKDLQSAGKSGEFYTPRAVTDFVVKMVDPKIGESVADFACGTGGFLVSALNHMKESAEDTSSNEELKKAFYGVEKKSLPYLLCTTNMLLHDINEPNIIRGNSLEKNVRDYEEDDKFYRKTIGDFGCYIVFVNSLCAR